MDLGGEVLEEVIRDWMFENELLMIVEEEEDVWAIDITPQFW